MKEMTLVIMAAGIGSRFGKGVKQLTPVGPSGELIMDYSVHDALNAGFDRVVFILRKDILDEFHRTIGKNIESRIKLDYVFQEIDDLPEGFTRPPERVKPWGTGKAILCCKDAVDGPFAVINADDYYGKEPYRLLHDYLERKEEENDDVLDICAAGFRLGNTLSDQGGVTRGLCTVDDSGYLTAIDETKNIIKTPAGAAVLKGDTQIPLDPDSIVSMNMWGFESRFIDSLETGFREFLTNLPKDDFSAEFLLPVYIDQLIREKKAKVRVLPTDAAWFGVTYQEDKPAVVEAFAKLVEMGEYQKNLYA